MPFPACFLFVTSGSRCNKISVKNSKCAVSNKHIQDGRPGRYGNRRRSEKTQKRHPHPAREKPPCNRIIPKIAVWCHLLRKTPSATSGTRRMAQEMKKLRSLHILHVPPSRPKLTLTPDVSSVCCTVFKVFADIW